MADKKNCDDAKCLSCDFGGSCPLEYGRFIGLTEHQILEIIDRVFKLIDRNREKELEKELNEKISNGGEKLFNFLLNIFPLNIFNFVQQCEILKEIGGEEIDLKIKYCEEILQNMPLPIREKFDKGLSVGDMTAYMFRSLILQRADQLHQLIINKSCLVEFNCGQCWLRAVCLDKRKEAK